MKDQLADKILMKASRNIINKPEARSQLKDYLVKNRIRFNPAETNEELAKKAYKNIVEKYNVFLEQKDYSQDLIDSGFATKEFYKQLNAENQDRGVMGFDILGALGNIGGSLLGALGLKDTSAQSLTGSDVAAEIKKAAEQVLEDYKQQEKEKEINKMLPWIILGVIILIFGTAILARKL